MLKPRFYYSTPMYEAEVKMLFTDDGEPLSYNRPKGKIAFPRITICGIWDTEKNTMSYGVATCCFKDRFERKIGRKLAYDRALNNPVKVFKTSTNISDLFLEEAQNIEYEYYAKLMEKSSYFRNL